VEQQAEEAMVAVVALEAFVPALSAKYLEEGLQRSPL
jgi:hypothetical protein